MPKNNKGNKPKGLKKKKSQKSQNKQPDGSASSTSPHNALLNKDDNSKDTTATESTRQLI